MTQRSFSDDSHSSYSEATPIVNKINQEDLPVRHTHELQPSLIFASHLPSLTHCFELTISNLVNTIIIPKTLVFKNINQSNPVSSLTDRYNFLSSSINNLTSNLNLRETVRL